MKVRELIEILKLEDPEKEVMIQQGEVDDYMKVYSVSEESLLLDENDLDNYTIVVCIKYL